MTEDQLQLVDSFEDSIRAEADQDFIALFEEHEKLQKDYITIHEQYLAHLVTHTSYIGNISIEFNRVQKELKSASNNYNFFLALFLASIVYIIFSKGV